MKKITLLFAALLIAQVSLAQEETPSYDFEQGNVFVEGNITFQSSKTGDADAQTNFEISPTIGFFTSDKVAFGASFLIGNSITEFEETGETSENNNFGAGVFGRFYILEMGNRFQAYTQASVSYLSQKPKEDNDQDLKFRTIGAGVGLGAQYFVTENILINFRLSDLLSYTTSKASFDGDEDFDIDSTNRFAANLNIFKNFFDTATFGATYRF